MAKSKEQKSYGPSLGSLKSRIEEVHEIHLHTKESEYNTRKIAVLSGVGAALLFSLVCFLIYYCNTLMETRTNQLLTMVDAISEATGQPLQVPEEWIANLGIKVSSSDNGCASYQWRDRMWFTNYNKKHNFFDNDLTCGNVFCNSYKYEPLFEKRNMYFGFGSEYVWRGTKNGQ